MPVTPLPILLPFAVVAYAGYRWYAQSSARSNLDEAVAWATARRLLPGDMPTPGATPTLSLPGGEAHDPWEVPIGDGTGSLYGWTWMIADDRSLTARELNMPIGLQLGSTTIVQAMLAAGFPHFRVVPRHGWVAPSGGWDEQEVQLESVEFSNDFKLLAAHDGDHEMLLRLFDPDTIVWFIGLGSIAPVIEYQLGTLAVVARHACTADNEFDALLEQAQHIAQRILAEGLLHRPDAAASA